jgi:hypothetical protein
MAIMAPTDRSWRATFWREDGQRIAPDWMDARSRLLAIMDGAIEWDQALDAEFDKYLSALREKRIRYVDLREFGLLIVEREVEWCPKLFTQLPNPSSEHFRGTKNDLGIYPPNTQQSGPISEDLPWYVKLDDRGWPSHKGKGVAVGVFDSWLDCSLDWFNGRVAPGDLIRLLPDSEVVCADDHGILTCGVIGAKSVNGQRIAMVPECRLIVGEHGPDGVRSVTMLRLLVFLCLLARMGGRIACVPFGVDQRVYSDDMCRPWLIALERFFHLLRTRYQLVCFCAAGKHGELVLVPACLDSCEAVFGYQRPEEYGDPVWVGGKLAELDGRGCPKGRNHILLGPAEKVRTIYRRGGIVCDCHGGSSAATAFVAGVAASVVGAKPDLSADGLVLSLIDDSELIETDETVNCKFYRVRIPL